jgi:hypothetical protein
MRQSGNTITTESRYLRVRQIVERHGLSKAWVVGRLADGSLRAIKIRGVVPVETESLDALFANAPRWQPKNAR